MPPKLRRLPPPPPPLRHLEVEVEVGVLAIEVEVRPKRAALAREADSGAKLPPPPLSPPLWTAAVAAAAMLLMSLHADADAAAGVAAVTCEPAATTEIERGGTGAAGGDSEPALLLRSHVVAIAQHLVCLRYCNAS